MNFRRRVGGVAALSIAVTLLLLPTLVAAESPSDIEHPLEEDTEMQELVLETFGVSTTTADIGDIGEALTVIKATITTRQARMITANQELESAERSATEAEANVAASSNEVEQSQRDLSDQAVLAFIDNATTNTLLLTGSPTDAARQDRLNSVALGSQNDALESLRSSRQSLQVHLVEAEAARKSVRRFGEETQRELLALEGARDALQETLDELLVERDERRRRATVVDASEIVDAGNGILVHVAIAEAVSQLLAAAEADGVVLAGGGYRDSAAQIRVRRNNCGSSNYAIYEMPASQCRPPTARPGSSMHERGLAIDFTYEGRIISSHSGPAWLWLAEHAAEYGLHNLPAEPWHFSTNGQ